MLGRVDGIMGGEARVTLPTGVSVKAVVGLQYAPMVGQRYGGNVLLVGDAEWGANGRMVRFVVDGVMDDPVPVDLAGVDA